MSPGRSRAHLPDAASIMSADGHRLHCYTWPAATGTGRPDSPVQVVMCHGFTHHALRPKFALMAQLLRRCGPVTAIDFRGHGASAGRSSVGGDDEVTDLDALIEWLRVHDPHTPIAVVGFSMGAAVAIRHAARGRHRPDAVVSVSAVSRWYVRDTPAMRRVHWVLESRLGPVVSRLLMGTRLGSPWSTLPAMPVDVAGEVTVPLLLVHGTGDRYYGVEHVRALAQANQRASVWVVQGMGHAESGMRPQVLRAIAEWISEHGKGG